MFWGAKCPSAHSKGYAALLIFSAWITHNLQSESNESVNFIEIIERMLLIRYNFPFSLLNVGERGRHFLFDREL